LITEKLLSENISSNPKAKILVVFGGDVHRRHQIIELLLSIENLTTFAFLSEEEGIDKIKELQKVDIVLIGGRYTQQQRINIKTFLATKFPEVKITEPGIGYTYSNENIFKELNKLN
jgi:Ni,Fe-hydrogenase III small subunit